jgi:cysteine desulfurase
MIYFDHNATTPIDTRVLEAMLPYQETFYGNPSSLYRHGRIARSAIDMARAQVAVLAGALPEQVIFTSGGTEANNLALTAAGKRLAISAIEHPSISEPAEVWAQRGYHLKVIPVNCDGLLALESFDEIRAFKPQLVSIMLANNETGVIQPIAEIASVLKKAEILVHTDAVQAAGKVSLAFSEIDVDLMSLSSHKIYGPKGCGALIIGKQSPIKPSILGGGQENGWRAGTENVAAIVGFGKAAELAVVELSAHAEHLTQLKKQLETGLKEISGITIFSEKAERLPNTTQFAIAGTDGEMLLMQLDQKRIAVSSGSACASGGGKPSPVLKAMGIPEVLMQASLRISLGKDNTEAEIHEFLMQLKQLLPP